jgi:hypothetical protein
MSNESRPQHGGRPKDEEPAAGQVVQHGGKLLVDGRTLVQLKPAAFVRIDEVAELAAKTRKARRINPHEPSEFSCPYRTVCDDADQIAVLRPAAEELQRLTLGSVLFVSLLRVSGRMLARLWRMCRGMTGVKWLSVAVRRIDAGVAHVGRP